MIVVIQEYYIINNTNNEWQYEIYNERFSFTFIVIFILNILSDFISLHLSDFRNKRKITTNRYIMYEIIVSLIFALLFYFNGIYMITELILGHSSFSGMILITLFFKTINSIFLMSVMEK